MKLTHALSLLGPGLVMAATGLGAGDMVTAAVAGATFGSDLLWAIVLGALLKLCLTEGLARWQLASGTSLLSGWHQYLPRWAMLYFFVYLLLWSFLVAAALMAACGLAAHALLPQLSIFSWAAIQSLLAAVLVLFGRYRIFEAAMKILIALMFLTVLTAVLAMDLGEISILRPLLIPRFPDNGAAMVLAVIGGVGGSVTLLCYGYWIKEKGWQNTTSLPTVRLDLATAYTLTALFAIAILLLAAKAAPEQRSGLGILLAIADGLGDKLGSGFRLLFLAGFWAAVFSSMLGVWQGVPYLFTDMLQQWQSRGRGSGEVSNRSPVYRGYLAFMAVPPLLMIWWGKPVWLVLVYSIAGAFFMPFLAATLLYLNNRILRRPLRNGWLSNVLLVAALLLFIVSAIVEWG